jgi:hypothetical protein
VENVKEGSIIYPYIWSGYNIKDLQGAGLQNLKVNINRTLRIWLPVCIPKMLNRCGDQK